MAIGKRKTDGERRLNWDFKIGKFVFEDRTRTDSGWENQQTNVENDKFRAVPDLPNLERGWIAYLKGEGLNTVLVPLGQDYGNPPSDKHREGLRLIVKMDESLGGDVREFISTLPAIWDAIDKLHDDYLTGVKEHAGCLPAVDVAATREVPGRDSPIRVPIFKINGWVPRPFELPIGGIPLFKRAKKADAGSDSQQASESFVRPKPQDSLNDEIPF
jgi:hypothetical protein